MFENATALVRRLFARMEAERGQALAEYSLILGLIAVVALVALGVLGLAVTEKIKLISEAIVA